MTEPALISSAVRDDHFVVVLVGPLRTRFSVHSALLIENSDYFRDVLTRDTKEVVLKDTDASTFNVFFEWLYINRIPLTWPEWEGATRRASERSEWFGTFDLLKEMLKVIALCERTEVPGLRRAVQNQYIDPMTNPTDQFYAHDSYKLIIYAFKNLHPDNPLLTFLVDVHCQTYKTRSEEGDELEAELRNQLPRDFLMRCMLRYGNRDITWHDESGRKIDYCSYHQHVSEEEKERCPRYRDRPLAAESIVKKEDSYEDKILGLQRKVEAAENLMKGWTNQRLSVIGEEMDIV